MRSQSLWEIKENEMMAYKFKQSIWSIVFIAPPLLLRYLKALEQSSLETNYKYQLEEKLHKNP